MIRKKRNAGFTLAEVMIAILLTAIVVTSVFGVCITAKQTSTRYDKKIVAKNAAQQVLAKLENYVAAANDSSASVLELSGPNQACGACGATSTWTLPIPSDVCGGCVHALASGAHTVTTLLPSKYQVSPYSMTMTYTVTDLNGGLACSGGDSTGKACARYKIVVAVSPVEP
ncbi:MAG: type II secretion system protein [Elusimicrobia bacterium]|nr:type II secretion system protein [Elusimicrobiota bacterium]